MVYAVGPISGGHFNPAVTLGLAVGSRFAWSEVLPYWIAQLVGGAPLVGAALGALIWAGLLGRD
jgi:aquaporin Z